MNGAGRVLLECSKTERNCRSQCEQSISVSEMGTISIMLYLHMIYLCVCSCVHLVVWYHGGSLAVRGGC